MILNLFSIKIFYSDYYKLTELIVSKKYKTVCYLNQHYANLVFEDVKCRNYLTAFDLVHPDGIGMQLVFPLLSGLNKLPDRINGSDLYLYLLDMFHKNKNSLFLLGDYESVNEKAFNLCLSQYKNIVLKGRHHGYFDNDDDAVIKLIKESSPEFLFVGLGPQKQEAWINKWKSEFPETVIIAVGGGLRVIANERHRGPKCIQNIGLEWFVRLVTEPRQLWKRYIIGIPLFIYRIIKYRFNSKSY